MRRSRVITAMLLSFMLVLAGCMENTGDLGNKNIRPNAVRNNQLLRTKSRYANDQHNEMNRINGDQRNNNNIEGIHGNSHLQLSEQIADQLTKMPGVNAAYVVVTEHNAYVAISQAPGTSQGTDLSDEFKTKIADKVKSLTPSAENVYVSANPDFASRMRNIATQTKNGHPIQGFLTEFNAMVERVFPANSTR